MTDVAPKKRNPPTKKQVPELVRLEEARRLTALWEQAKYSTTHALTQNQFAIKYDVGGQAYVQQILNGVRPLNIETALKFSSYLRCDVDQFSPRLHAEIVKLVAAVKSHSKYDDITSRLTPEVADFIRKFDQLPEHDKKEVTKLVNDRYNSIVEVLNRLAGKSASERLEKLTQPNQLIS